MDKKEKYEIINEFLSKELGVTKDSVVPIIEKIVDRSVKKYVDRYFESNHLKQLVASTISQSFDQRGGYGALTPQARDQIRKTISDLVISQVRPLINFSAVNIVVTENAPTPYDIGGPFEGMKKND